MMQVEVIENVSLQRWKQIIKNAPASYFFYTPEWATILQNTYGYRAAPVLFEVDGIEILVPMMEIGRFPFISLESMPLGYGGFFSPEKVTATMLRGMIKQIVRGWHLNLYMTLPPFTQITPKEDFQIHKIQTEWDYTHVLPLDTNYERVERNFHRGSKRRIKLSEKSAITIRITSDPMDYRSFYDLYVTRSKKWGYAKPPHPWALYENLQHYGGRHAVLRIAEVDGCPIGGAITLEYGINAFLWMIISSSKHKQYESSYLMLHEIIRDLCEHCFTHINLGGSGRLEGVRQFKESFGAVRVPIYRYEACSLLGKILLRR